MSKARRPVLKSPAHGFRVATLTLLFPRVRFVLLVRDPITAFESVARMWRSLSVLYAFTPLPSDDILREIVLADRLRFEDKIWQGLEAIPADRRVQLRYEDLGRDPEGALKGLYDGLGLDGFGQALPASGSQAAAVASYPPASILPQGLWRDRVAQVWHPFSRRYGYS